MGTEVVITDANKNNAFGQITITSPHEGVIVRCNKVVGTNGDGVFWLRIIITNTKKIIGDNKKTDKLRPPWKI